MKQLCIERDGWAGFFPIALPTCLLVTCYLPLDLWPKGIQALIPSTLNLPPFLFEECEKGRKVETPQKLKMGLHWAGVG